MRSASLLRTLPALISAFLLASATSKATQEIIYTSEGRGAIDAEYFANLLLNPPAAGQAYTFVDAGPWLEPEEFEDYKVVIIFSRGASAVERAWDDEDVMKAYEWVENGGLLIMTGNAPYRLTGNNRNLTLLEPLLGGTRYQDGGEILLGAADHPLLAPLEGREDLLVGDVTGVGQLTSAIGLIYSGDAAQFLVNEIGEGAVIYLGVEFTRYPEETRELYAELLFEALQLAELTLVEVDRSGWGLTPLGPTVEVRSPEPPPIRNEATGTLKNQTSHQDPLTLISDGEAQAVLVLPDLPSPAAREAAALLQSSLEKATGVTLPILHEEEITWRRGEGGAWRAIRNGRTLPAVLIGATGPALPFLEDLPPEGYRLKSLPNQLFIVAGADETPDGLSTRGSYFGAIGLLERHLGFRWLWPGELGKIFPSGNEVVIPAVNESNAPAVALRRMRSSGYAFNDRNLAGMERLGVSPDHFREQTAVASEWSDRQRLGAHVRLSFGHSYSGWWDRYGRDHPEWFALQPNGSRTQSPPRERLCVSNQELTEAIATERIAELISQPSLKAVSVSPNDGSGQNNFCMCAECRAFDSPDGPVVGVLMTYDGFRRREPYASLTDRYLDFYNRIAESVAEEFPERWVAGYAYSAYRSAPLYTEVHPNLLIGFVGLDYFDEHTRNSSLENWNGWAQSAQQIFLRPNALLGGHGFPANYVRKLADDVRHCYETGMVASDCSSISGHWAAQGLNYYVLPRLLWDPGADVEAMVRDYCEQGFGPAADEVLVYFAMLEDLTNQVAASVAQDQVEELRDEEVEFIRGRDRFLAMAPEIYTAEALDALRHQLDRAEQAAGDDQVVRQRIDFLRQGLTYADLQSRLYALRNEEEPDQAAGQAVLQERYEFFRDVFENDFFAVGVPHVTWREGWVARNPFGWSFPAQR